jgi:thioesterase domain-containing protein
VYVLDAGLAPAPAGVAGEVYVGGAGVARGYLGRPALTAARFVPDPFAAAPGARLYRTGDRARRRADGALEFLGRLDAQVKLRGHRIELGEIEAALSRHPAVQACTIAVREDAGSGATAGERRLVAYVVPRAGEPAPEPRELRTFLARSLPEYMLPAAIVSLAALPLTPNGKLDRAALPAPPASTSAPADGRPAGPRDSLELQLLAIWEEVLGLPRVGVHDDFFALGGHSLLAARLFAEIQHRLGRNLPIATLFRAPTVRELAAIVREEGAGASDGWRSLVVLQRGSAASVERVPFFLIHGVGGNVLGYRDLALHLGRDQPVYALQSVGLDGDRPPYARIGDMAAHYIREMRSVQPRGPYMVGGLSFGGTVAYEIAQQLTAAGEEVSLLVMFDSFPPRRGNVRRGIARAGERMRMTVERVSYHVRQVLDLPGREKLAYVQARAAKVRRRVASRLWRRAYRRYERLAHPLPAALWRVHEANAFANREYEMIPYVGRVTLFRARERSVGETGDPTLGWSYWARGGVDVHEVPGGHLSSIQQPHVQVFAACLRQCIDLASARARSATA